ncbi:M23 family metallopeptidase [Nocardioides piscis]|uniref:M23 family metallopeptidase n=1 Tax=Nocardioides piscis TaxID=2714938 RepID=A0A6G7YI01_9ACTN|nr:M23 family metallopeptidase [Nocardioides piscis]QIK76445.1 M23 family metallopeptidase [Nocardioides piscis]
MLLGRVATAVIGACASLLFVAGPASAVPSDPTGGTAKSARSAKAPSALEAAVARHVDHREQALTAMMSAADEHAAVEQVRAQRLAALGYHGDVTDLDHVLPVPADSYRISAGFGLAGAMWASTHTGLDFAASSGTPLVAVADATVTEVADAGPYGLRTILTLEDGTEVWYAHQLLSLVEPGQTVELGESIGMVGSTGNSTGPHLHLEIHPDGGDAIDPVEWLTGHDLAP